MSYTITKSIFLDSVASASMVSKHSDLVPQVAFVGRSNSGKSTLLNGLCNRKALAKVSNTPGRTQLINYFEVEYLNRTTEDKNISTAYFVDLPGYGFAKVSLKMRNKWSDLILKYLKDLESSISTLVLIVDMRRKFTEDELWFFDIFPQSKISLVLTKSDKLKSNEKKKKLKYFKEELSRYDLSSIALHTSSLVGKDKTSVYNLNNYILGNCEEFVL